MAKSSGMVGGLGKNADECRFNFMSELMSVAMSLFLRGWLMNAVGDEE